MNIKSIVCALVTLFFLTNSYAENVWTGPRQLVSVQVVEHGGFIVQFENIIDPICTAAGVTRLYVYSGPAGATTQGVESMLNSAMTAMANNMPVDIMYDNSTEKCWGRYLLVRKG